MNGSGGGRGKLRLADAQREQLIEWSEEARPREACGLLVGARTKSAATVGQVHRLRNLAPGNARYRASPEEFLALQRAARAEALEIVGIWHSHPEGRAVPSAVDLDEAWNGYSYVIVGLASGAPALPEVRSWCLVEDRFREQPILRVGPALREAP